MPLTDPQYAERESIAESNRNYKAITQDGGGIITATVIANYGDPGLNEDYHCDILSRYIICIINSPNRLITADTYKNGLSFVAVKRPENLWINYQGGYQNNVATQKRVDANSNSNTGPAINYSINQIPPINYPYQLGEQITLKKLDKIISLNGTDDSKNFFNTECTENIDPDDIGDNKIFYQKGQDGGFSDSYISSFNLKPIKTINNVGLTDGFFNIALSKVQYEAAMLNISSDYRTQLVNLFEGYPTYPSFKDYCGGYLFYGKAPQYQAVFNTVQYEDLNAGPERKERISISNCVPAIITTPNTFSVPTQRSTATINYTPTYITKDSGGGVGG
jgi:hypothetical protein